MENTNIFETKSGRIPENLMRTITQDDISKAKIVTWSDISAKKANYSPNDSNAIHFRILLSNDVADIFRRRLFNESEHKAPILPPLFLLCEYNEEEKQSINYYVTSTIHNKQRMCPANDDFACSYLDSMVHEKMTEMSSRTKATATKRFNTCKITVKNNDIVISKLDSSIVTVLSRAQWEELTDFVDNELNYRNDVIDYLKSKFRGSLVLENTNVVNKLVELYGKKRRACASTTKSVSECIDEAIVDYLASQSN